MRALIVDDSRPIRRIEGEILTLTQVGSEDPCPHRKVLLGYEYERRDT